MESGAITSRTQPCGEIGYVRVISRCMATSALETPEWNDPQARSKSPPDRSCVCDCDGGGAGRDEGGGGGRGFEADGACGGGAGTYG